MAILIESPTIVKAAGNKPKEIREYFGRVNSSTDILSIAHMKSPEGWKEPGQTPEFDEYTMVLKGTLKVETKSSDYLLQEGQAILIEKGEWVCYSTPNKNGAEYIAVCIPAFSPETVNRDS
jgi:mannose-6-phosphate isomerase-like protein (cupin superfamily)